MGARLHRGGDEAHPWQRQPGGQAPRHQPDHALQPDGVAAEAMTPARAARGGPAGNGRGLTPPCKFPRFALTIHVIQRDDMYLSHFGLNEAPFRITPHTEFFFSGANRGATLEALLYAITHDEGIVKVTGEVG